jgi:Flp pilus assembly pilin Flp
LIAFWNDEGAATSIEYAMIGAIISVACVAGARTIGYNMNSLFYNKIGAGFS